MTEAGTSTRTPTSTGLFRSVSFSLLASLSSHLDPSRPGADRINRPLYSSPVITFTPVALFPSTIIFVTFVLNTTSIFSLIYTRIRSRTSLHRSVPICLILVGTNRRSFFDARFFILSISSGDSPNTFSGAPYCLYTSSTYLIRPSRVSLSIYLER
ncbi:hypothetical protein BMS3Bbin07_00606 [bacterium BMS3Bbin07]|nr:hypothetical protein BMS3Bbin07_00606 [bacterium BMS3Bbin07]